MIRPAEEKYQRYCEKWHNPVSLSLTIARWRELLGDLVLTSPEEMEYFQTEAIEENKAHPRKKKSVNFFDLRMPYREMCYPDFEQLMRFSTIHGDVVFPYAPNPSRLKELQEEVLAEYGEWKKTHSPVLE